jgi:hypothetical protein
MSAMSRHVTYWILNTICFQHNVQNRLMFIFYTTFLKFISVSDLKNLTIAMKQNIVKLFYKINNKRMNISFSNAFYVFECFFNLISFDQLNDLCSMTYKFEMFIVEDQNIITRRRVNNVFFFKLWKHVNYNFIVTFIVDNFAMSSNESRITINKNTLNVWHARLKYLRNQNVRRLVKMSKRMNLIKLITNKNLCESYIVIKQKIESHNNLVIFDKHSLNLIRSDLVQSFVFNDKIKYFVTFLCDFIKQSMIYVFRVKFNTFNVFKHFQQHNEYENNRIRRFRIDWKKNTSMTSLTIIALNTTLSENQSCSRRRNKTKSSNVRDKFLC